MSAILSRRELLRRVGLGAAGLVLAACQPKVVEVEKVVKETVVVEKEVPKEVEKVIKETVVVEKEVQAPQPTRGPIELVGWSIHGMNPDDENSKPKQETVLAVLKDMHPNTTFRFQDMGWGEPLNQNLITGLLGGTAPDLICGESYIRPFAIRGAFLPLDDDIADIKSNLIPGTYAHALVDGKIYGIAQITQCFGFESNPNVVEKAGLDPKVWPKTWSELVERANAITRAGNGEFYGYTLQGPAGWAVAAPMRYGVYIQQAGATYCRPPECLEPWFDNPTLEKPLSFLREINRYTPPGLTFNPDEGAVYTQLFQGVTAYQICGGWHVKWARDVGLENAMYGPVPIPDQNGQHSTLAVANLIIQVLQGSKHPREAIDFCKIMARDDVVAHNLPLWGLLPPTWSGLDAAEAKADSSMKVFIDIIRSAPDMGFVPQWPDEPDRVWAAFNEVLMTRLFTTEEPVVRLMQEAQKAVEEALAG